MPRTAVTGLRAIALAVVAAAVSTAVLLTPTGGSAEAAEGELPVNALAAEITDAAERAEVAFDAYLAYGRAADHAIYREYLALTAELAARQLGYDEQAMVTAWADASPQHQQAVLAAMTQIGVPYRSNASAEGEAFDCSGLTLYAWDEAGVELNRISRDQIAQSEQVGRDGAEAGDLVYYPGHVMMYLGVDDAIVHSVNSGRTVEIDTISSRKSDSVRFGDPTG